MNQTDVVWVLFLSPVIVLAAGGLVYWIVRWQDRAEERRMK